VRWWGSFDAAVHDVNYDAVEIPPNVVSRDSYRLNSLGADPSITSLIALRVFSKPMRHSIDLDGKPSSLAEEVENEWTERVLPSKLKPIRAQLQHAPEPDFGRAHPFTELTRLVD
jgi:hypothetical protein